MRATASLHMSMQKLRKATTHHPYRASPDNTSSDRGGSSSARPSYCTSPSSVLITLAVHPIPSEVFVLDVVLDVDSVLDVVRQGGEGANGSLLGALGVIGLRNSMTVELPRERLMMAPVCIPPLPASNTAQHSTTRREIADGLALSHEWQQGCEWDGSHAVTWLIRMHMHMGMHMQRA